MFTVLANLSVAGTSKPPSQAGGTATTVGCSILVSRKSGRSVCAVPAALRAIFASTYTDVRC